MRSDAFDLHTFDVVVGIDAEDLPMEAYLRALLVLPVLVLGAGPGSLVMITQMRDGDPAARLQAASKRFDAALVAARAEGALQPQSSEFSRLTQEFARLSDELVTAGNAADAAFALLRSADCLRIMRRWDDARPVYRRDVALAQKARRSDYEAKAWLGIARLEKFGAQNHRAARDAIDRALEAAGSAADTAILRGDILLERADLEAAAGDLDSALASASEAVKIARASPDRDLQFNTLFNRAGVHNRLTEELFKLYTSLPCLTAEQWQQCQQLAREMEDHVADARDDFQQARTIAMELGQTAFAAAIQEQLSSMQLIGQARTNTIAISAQMYDLAQKQAAASTIGGLVTPDGKLLEMPLLGPALPTTTPEQTEAMLAFMRRELSQIPDLPDTRWRRRITQAQILEGEGDLPSAIASYREAATLIEQERRTLPSEATRAGFTKDKVHVFDRLVLALLSRGDHAEAFRWNEQARARTMSEMLTSAGAQPGRLSDLVDTASPSLDRLRRLAKSDQFDLAYFILDGSRLVIWHIGPERMDVQSFYAPATALRSLAVRLQRNLATRSAPFDRDAARDLYTALVGPLRDRLDTAQLVVVLPPELENVPFAALVDPETGVFLGESVKLSYAPSASVLMRLRQGAPLANVDVLAIAGPGLGNAVRDAEAIARTFTRHTVVPPTSATRSTLMAAAPKRAVLHLAAHGVYHDDDPMQSYIELQPEPGHSGHLTASEMLALPLEGTTLVTVASCTAARVAADSGREIYGITRSLIYAGAQNILLPLWEVDDEATSYWMEAFYRAATQVPLAEAVRRTNIEVRRHPVYGADPRLWAAFKLVGH